MRCLLSLNSIVATGLLLACLVPFSASAQTPLTGVLQVAAGGLHTCAIVGGGVSCWGDNAYGQLGDGFSKRRTTPTAIAGLSGVTAIAAGAHHTCAIISGGEVSCWGSNDRGQLGNGSALRRMLPTVIPGLSGVKAISAGSEHTCAITRSGGVMCWGENGSGQLGDGSTANRATPTATAGMREATRLAAGRGHTCAIAGGEVMCWGGNRYGQLGDGSTKNSTIPTAVAGLRGTSEIASGDSHTCAVASDGGVSCWGASSSGSDSLSIDGGLDSRTTPTVIAGLSGITAVAAGGLYTCVTTRGGEVSCWGSSLGVEMGGTRTPTAISGLSGVTGLAVGGDHFCAIIRDGGLSCWGYGVDGLLGDGSVTRRTSPATITGLSGATAIATGSFHFCVIAGGGGAACVGANRYGQLGDGSTRQRTSLTAIAGLSGVTALAGGFLHTCAIAGRGRVSCWGYNGSGQLGDGSPLLRTTPTEVAGLSGVTVLVTGMSHTCAIVGGEVFCWGNHYFGRLGYCSSEVCATPTAITGLSGATGLAAGADHTCVIVGGGQVSCWGANANGVLGDGTTRNRTTPATIAGLSGVTAIAAGWDHTCAITLGGGVSCWGYNGSGQLGDGTTTNRTTPTPVAGLSDVTALVAGNNHTCAIGGGGVVLCWGKNDNGQLGDGSTISRTTPTVVAGLSGVTALAAGAGHTCAIASGGRVSCWGANSSGQFGDGSAAVQPTPRPVVLGDIAIPTLPSGAGDLSVAAGSSVVVSDNESAGSTLRLSGSGTTRIGIGDGSLLIETGGFTRFNVVRASDGSLALRADDDATITVGGNNRTLLVAGGLALAGLGGDNNVRARYVAGKLRKIAVLSGAILLPGNAFAASAGKLHAGEVAEFDANERIVASYLGSLDGAAGQLGDPLPLAGNTHSIPLAIPAGVPRLAGLPERQRLQGHTAQLDQQLTQVLQPFGLSASAQDAQGVIRLSGDERHLTVLPLGRAQVAEGEANTLTFGADGSARVVLNGYAFRLVPAVADPGALANAMAGQWPGTTARLGDEGEWHFTESNGRTTVVRPGWALTPANGNAGLRFDASGNLFFAHDARLGSVLYPALADRARLLAAARQLDPAATLTSVAGGETVLTLSGKHYVLSPEAVLVDVPAAHAGDPFWLAGGRLYVPVGNGRAQGFGVR